MTFRLLIKKTLQVLKSLHYEDTYKKLDKCDVLLICHDNDLGITKDNKAYSPLIDSLYEILDGFGWKCARFLLPYTHMTENQAFGSPVRANRKLFLLTLLYKIRIFLRLNSLFRYYSKKSDILTTVLFYKTFFQAIECKCIVGIGLNSSICKAANELGIFSVEVAHGIGYAQLSLELSSLHKSQLPKGIITFDTISYNTYSALETKGVEVKYIPHLWLSRFESEEKQTLPFEWTKEIRIDEKYQKVILLTLQWGYDGEASFFDGILKNGILSPCIERAIKETTNDVFWFIRMHPIQLRDSRYDKHRSYVKKLVQQFANCDWEQASTLPLPSLLLKCDGHLTMSSMSSYEAAYMGIKTLLLCPTLKEGNTHQNYFKDLQMANMADLGSLDTVEIIRWIKSVKKTTKYSFSPRDTLEETIEWMLGRVRW